MIADYLVVGAGLTGAVIARTLHDHGCHVTVVDRRTHKGGNVHDEHHASGIRIHTYGPHYFRTASKRIWDFVHRFDTFYPFEARVQTLIDGEPQWWPIAADYLQRTVGLNWEPGFTGTPQNFEQASLAMMPREIYEKFVKPYTEKQWGVPASTLAADLAKRFQVRHGNDTRLMQHAYQGLPRSGYAVFMEKMLEGIPVKLDCDYLKTRSAFDVQKMVIYTGPIDEYFGFDLGRLAYRSQLRTHQYVHDAQFVQHTSQLNNPSPTAGSHIRTIEWKHLLEPAERDAIRGSVLTQEHPFSPDDPNQYEYPFPSESNAALYSKYRDRATQDANLLVCGRLGEYKYYDMDQAIARALVLAERLLAQR